MDLPEIDAITYCSKRNKFANFHIEDGFSLLELIVVITIIALLFVVAIDKLLILKVEAERTAMQTILGNIRSAMAIQVADHITRDDVDSLAKSEGLNPMDWLSSRPDGYIGVLDEPDPADVEPFKWYFDSYNNQLVYRVGNSDYFISELDGPKRARFKLKLDYTDADNNGRYNKKTDKIHGLRLDAVEPYKWLAEPVNIEDYANNAGDNVNSAVTSN